MAITKITSRVIDSGAITSTHLAAGAVTHSSLSGITTDNVTEGSTNLYYANSLVDSHLSGGTGVTYSSGAISIGQDVGTSATPTFGNITTTGYLAGPATFTIDPAAVGDNTGTVVIAGNLQVDGTTTTINSTTMTVDDLNLTLASGALNVAATNGAGITVDTANASLIYDATTDDWRFNKALDISSSDLMSLTYQRTGVSAKKWGFDSDNSATYWVNVTDNLRPLTVYNDGRVVVSEKIGVGVTGYPSKALHLSHATDTDGILIDHETVGGFSDILFRTKNNASSQIAMNRIRSDMIDGTTGAEDSELTIYGMHQGSEKVGLVLDRNTSTYISSFTTFDDYSDTGASSNYFELGTWNSGQSGRITIRINGANSYSNEFAPAGETVIHGTITNLPDFEGFFYGITSYGTISNVAIKQNGNDYTIYVLPGTYASYEAHVTITHNSNWVPKHSGADTGSTSAPSGSVQLQSLYSISTGGSRKLTITSGGSVGIGNTGPTALLHLGNSGMTTNPVGIGIQNNTRYYALEVNSGALRVKDVSAGSIERLRLTSDGKLAIGDIATAGDPNRYLSVYSPSTQSSGFNDVVEFMAPSQTGGGVSVNFGVANSTKNVGKIVFNYGSSGSNNNNIGLGFYDADNLMVIKANGNVGIGTDPEETLHVLGQAVFENAGNTNRGNIIMGGHGNGTSKWATLAGTHYNEATGSGNGSENAGIMIIGSHSTSTANQVWIGHGPYEINPATEIRFGTHTTNTHNLGGTTHMIIDSAGNVGIGTGGVTSPGLWYDATNDYLAISHWATPPTPAAMLHLSDNSNDIDVPQIRIEGRENPGDTRLDIAVKDPDIRFNLVEGATDAAAGYGKMIFKTNAAANTGAVNRGGFVFETVTDSNNLVITNTAKVGIGTASPTEKLHVTGKIRSEAQEVDYAARYSIASGTYIAGTFYDFTDRSTIQALGYGNGIYVFKVYDDTYGAGGGNYFVHYLTEPFYFHNVGSNAAGAFEFTMGSIPMGHAANGVPGGNQIRIRMLEQYGGSPHKFQWSPGSGNLTIDGTGGKTIQIDLFRYA